MALQKIVDDVRNTTALDATKLSGTLPAISGTNLTSLPAANLTGTLPAISGASLTNLPAGGAWVKIGTQEVTSAVASLTQTGLDSTYDLYCISISDMVPATDSQGLNFRCGDSSGVDSAGTDYSYHAHRSTDDSGAYSAIADAGRSEIVFGRNPGNAAGEGVGFIVWLHRPGNGTTFPTFSWTGCSVEADSTISMCVGGGARNSAITLDRFFIFFTSGNIASGRMTVWGVSHA